MLVSVLRRKVGAFAIEVVFARLAYNIPTARDQEHLLINMAFLLVLEAIDVAGVALSSKTETCLQ